MDLSNIFYEDKKYNPEIKKEFMSEYQETTQSTILRIFKVSYQIEEDLNKDLYDFNREQIRRLLFLFAPKTEYSSKNNISWIRTYINWSIDRGYLMGVNPLVGIPSDWAAQFVGTSLKQLWKEEEILKITSSNRLENAQDAIVPTLRFYGVGGQENNEMLNLRKSGVLSSSNELKLYDSFTKKERTIKVPEHVIKLCEAALRETDYVKSNGSPSKDLKAKATARLVENDFVVKSSVTRTDHTLEAEKNIVYRRFDMIKVKEEISEPNFTPNNIGYSGMLHMAKELYLEIGELGDAEYQQVFKQFGEDSEPVQNRIKSEFLNLETIKSLYELS